MSCLCAALWLIQVVPDVFALIQDIFRLKIAGKTDRSLITSVRYDFRPDYILHI